MKRDPSGKGFSHLGKDGVFRTISGNYEILDARGLNPEQIKQFLALIPPGHPGHRASMEEDFRGVDGTRVTSYEALFGPAPGILPENPREKESERQRQLVEDNKAAYEEETKRNL
jgi:hypothetical protein